MGTIHIIISSLEIKLAPATGALPGKNRAAGSWKPPEGCLICQLAQKRQCVHARGDLQRAIPPLQARPSPAPASPVRVGP